MNAQEVVAVVLAAGGGGAIWGTARCCVPIGGIPSLERARHALTEAGIRDAFLVAESTPEGGRWSGVAPSAEAPGMLARWSKGRLLLLLCGDLPLLTAATIRQFVDAAAASRADRFVEATGTMAVFRSSDEAVRILGQALRALGADSAGLSPCGDGTWRSPNADDVRRLASPADFAPIERLARLRKAKDLAQSGVLIVDPERTYIDDVALIGAGTTLLPGTHIVGASTIGAGCSIGPDTWIESSVVEDGSAVRYSVVEGARVRERSTVGPFAHLRPKSDIGPEARVGNFVEVKASRLRAGVKAGHLAYLGDADVGARTNVGAGAITCNFDGNAKNKTTIGENVFVGTNVSLVAPVSVGDGAFLAAGSTITDDVPPEGLAIARARQVNKERREKKSREGT